MSSGRFLIDATDSRFLTADNADVVAFIRVANPFAHTDVGSLVFDAARRIDGAHAYCPSVASCAYVVLHTASYRIVAIAYHRRELAVRLSASARAEAIAAGHQLAPAIGSDWVNIDPWPAEPTRTQQSPLDWMARAFAEAALSEH